MADIFDMVDTWNNGATTFTSIKMNVTDTASAAASLLMDLLVGGASKFSVSKGGEVVVGAGSATVPSLSFVGDPDTGFYNLSTNSLGVTSGGSVRWLFRNDTTFGFQSGSLMPISWAAASGAGGSGDLFLWRDTTDRLALRRGTNAQAMRIYGTYTDASNNEFANVGWNGTTAEFGTQFNGTGVARNVNLVRGGTTFLQLASVGIIALNHLQFSADNTYDIGSSGGNRPRDIFSANRIVASGVTQGSQLRISDGVTAPGAVAGVAVIYVDTADGDLKVVFSDGVVKTLATDT